MKVVLAVLALFCFAHVDAAPASIAAAPASACADFHQAEIADENYVTSFDVSPTDATIAVAGRHGIDLYDTVTFAPIASAPISLKTDEHFIWISAVDWSADGDRLAGSIIYWTKDKFNERVSSVRIGIWKRNGKEMEQVAEIPIPKIETMTDLSWSPDGRFVAVISDWGNREIYIADVDKGEIVYTYMGETDPGKAHFRLADWSPDGKYLAAATEYYTRVQPNPITIVRVDGWRVARTLETEYREIRSVAWSSKGRLAVASGEIAIWDPLSSWLLASRFLDSRYDHHSIAWSPDGNFLAGGGTYEGHNGIVVYDAYGDRQLTLVGQPIQPSSIRWSPDGESLWSYASAYSDYTIFEWDIAHRCVKTILAAGDNAEIAATPAVFSD